LILPGTGKVKNLVMIYDDGDGENYNGNDDNNNNNN
jgi:hypothetical protein